MDSLFDNKKAPDAGPDFTGGFGGTSGQPAASSYLLRPLASNDPKKKPYGDLGTVGVARATPTTATSLGEGARRAVSNAIRGGMDFVDASTGRLEGGLNALTLPARYVAGQAVDAIRGFNGQAPRADAGTPLAGVSLPRPFDFSKSAGGAGGSASPDSSPPDFSNVRSGSTAMLGQPLPRPGAALSAASTPAGGGADLVPGLRTLDGRAGSAASGIGGFGENVYDNASIARLTAGAGAPLSAVPTQSAYVPVGASPQIQRPTFGGNPVGASIAIPGEAERKLEMALDGSTFMPARSRGARAAQAQRVDGLLQRANLGDQLAAQANNAQLEASTRTNITQMGEAGQNYRTELSDAGQTQRTAMGEQGANMRAQLTLNRPEYMTDGSGQVNYVQNGVARPVLTSDGQPMRSRNVGGLSASEVKDAYEKARQAVIDTTPMGQQPDFTALAQSPVGRAFASLFEGPAGPLPRLQRVGQPDEYRQSILHSFSQGQSARAPSTPAERARVATSRGFRVQPDAKGVALVEIDGQWWPL